MAHTEGEGSWTDMQTHECWHCGTVFPNQPDLFKHITAHICFFCHDIFCRLEYLDEHIKTHAGADCIKCLKCGDNFTNKYDLLNHMKTHTNQNEVEKVANYVLKAQGGEILYESSGCNELDDISTTCSPILDHNINEISQNKQSVKLENENFESDCCMCKTEWPEDTVVPPAVPRAHRMSKAYKVVPVLPLSTVIPLLECRVSLECLDASLIKALIKGRRAAEAKVEGARNIQ